MEKTEKIQFQVETSRILDILANEIYDSPYALLRENTQNAYDAILMRKVKDTQLIGLINIIITQNSISIQDNGIGMSKEVLSNNFWKAGSSGKRNNELAKKAGVVGTFGIGAMANFGVCDKLEVKTKSLEYKTTYLSIAEKSKLDIAKDCIELYELPNDTMPIGTIITAYLPNPIDISSAIDYLKPYIEYLPIVVKINDKVYSQKNFEDLLIGGDLESKYDESYTAGVYKFKMACNILRDGSVKLKIYSILYNSLEIDGFIILKQSLSYLMAFRSHFGLSPVPVNSLYDLGGYVNLSILQPTAGREALSRESIEFINRFIGYTEQIISEKIALSPNADNNKHFQSYIWRNAKYELSGNIRINVKPSDNEIALKDVLNYCSPKKVFYYTGTNSKIIQVYANENTCLLHVSQSNPKREIQLNYLRKNNIEQVDESPKILKKYEKNEIQFEELSLLIKISFILEYEYLIPNSEVYIAEIFPDVPFYLNYKNNILIIYLSRNSSSYTQLIQTSKYASEIFNGFVRDFIRINLYPMFSQYVPSASKNGADAIYKILLKNNELYSIHSEEEGKLESIFAEYVTGDITFEEVLNKVKNLTKFHTQTVQPGQVGAAENEFHNIIHSVGTDQKIIDRFTPVPPIIRTDTETNKKLIYAEKGYNELNEFKMFLGLSDKLFKSDMNFFLHPHSTKVIWGGHKVVYIFSHGSNNLSLYYDIELKEKLDDESIGGNTLLTTTIIMKNRIFVPIPQNLENSFKVISDTKEFFIRYDLIVVNK